MGAQLQGQTVTVQLPENATWIWGAGNAFTDKDGGWWSNGRIYYDATTKRNQRGRTSRCVGNLRTILL